MAYREGGFGRGRDYGRSGREGFGYGQREGQFGGGYPGGGSFAGYGRERGGMDWEEGYGGGRTAGGYGGGYGGGRWAGDPSSRRSMFGEQYGTNEPYYGVNEPYYGRGSFEPDYGGFPGGQERMGRGGYGGYAGYGGYGGAVSSSREGAGSWWDRTTGRYGERGRQSYSGRGPKGYRRSDDRIRDDVSERLAMDPDIDATEIEVVVENGEVTLIGVVEDRGEKRMAEDDAEDIFGVNDVHNQLKVRHGFLAGLTGEKASDRDTARAADREVARPAEREGGETTRRGTRSGPTASTSATTQGR